jgi:branched-chain amino acid transport system substrate-binding protein
MKINWLFTIALIVVCTVGCKDSKSEKDITIGWIGVLTGEAAPYGISVKNGTELAVEEINRNDYLKGHKLNIVYQDDKADPKTGINIMNYYIDKVKPIAIIQAAASSVMLANIPIAEKNKIVYISPSCSNDKIKDGGDYIFRIWPSDSYQGIFIARYIYNKLGIKNAATIYINNDFGIGLNKAFIDEFKNLGGNIVAIESFKPAETDMRTQISHIKKSPAEIIFIPSHINETMQVLKESIELDVRIPFFADAASFSNELLSVKNDIYISNLDWSVNSQDSLINIFANNYKKKFNLVPDIYAAVGYDCIFTLANSLNKCTKIESISLKKALYEVSFRGVTGDIKFDKDGEIQKNYSVYKIKNSNFILQ